MSPVRPVFLEAATLQPKQTGSSTSEIHEVEMEPSINRFTFREVLLGELGDAVHFDYKFTHYERMEDGRIRAWFDNGEHVDVDVLVGADGGGSKVRQQYKPSVEIFDTGGKALYTKVYLDAERRKELSYLVGNMKGVKKPNGDAPVSLILEDMAFNQPLEDAPTKLAPGVKISAQQDYLYVVFAGSPEWFDLFEDDLFNLNGKELLELAKRKTSHWHPQIGLMLDLADPELTAVYHLRNVHPYRPWAETTQVVLIGDALHPMTPVGIGGNAALFDAYELSNQLVSVRNGEKELLAALRDYELPAIIRGNRDVRNSSRGGVSMFNQKTLPEEDMVIAE